ncbi:MAG: hypothetical protein KatS3mg056_3711 [Chloroflexus sp.]|nr:MAG: hypothetical protein KatS3mg056_3711 [Chloroflexus sp.]
MRVFRRFQLIVARLSATRPGAWFVRTCIQPFDRFLLRISGGRFGVVSLVFPTLTLITTGARSGVQRRTPLLFFPDGQSSSAGRLEFWSAAASGLVLQLAEESGRSGEHLWTHLHLPGIRGFRYRVSGAVGAGSPLLPRLRCVCATGRAYHTDSGA